MYDVHGCRLQAGAQAISLHVVKYALHLNMLNTHVG